MVTGQRRDQNKRESWFVKNLTNKNLAIGDLATVPTFAPGQSHDILRFVSRERASHSTDLQSLLRINWVSLKKVDPNRTKQISNADESKSTLPATQDELGSGGGASSLADLTDVDLTGLVDANFLRWDATAGKWEPVASSSTVNDIGDISNVNTSGLQDGDLLVYDTGTSTWIVTSASGAVLTLDDIGNVDTSGKVEGDSIKWNPAGSNWIVSSDTFTSGDIELELEFKLTSLNRFKELLYTGDQLTTINIWETSAKIVKIFQKDLTYTADQLTQTLLTRISDSATLTKDLVYSGDQLSTVEVTKA